MTFLGKRQRNRKWIQYRKIVNMITDGNEFSPYPRLLPERTHKVFLDVKIEGDQEQSGRIVLGLFGDIAPKTVENFRSLCACDKGNGKLTGHPLCYRGSKFHRISEYQGKRTSHSHQCVSHLAIQFRIS